MGTENEKRSKMKITLIQKEKIELKKHSTIWNNGKDL
jgi:hypothetical protein